MWEIKTFDSYEDMTAWIEKNSVNMQITVLFVENGYAVEYRKLVEPRLPR